MDEPEQSLLVSSSAAAAPAPPRFQYQFVREPEAGGRGDGADEDEEDEEEEEDEDFDEQLEVMERRPAPAVAAAPPAPAPQRLELGGGEQPQRPAAPEPPPPPPRPGSPAGLGSSSSSSAASTPSPEPARPAPLPPAPRRRGPSSAAADETLFALPAASEPLIYSSAEKVMDLQEKPGSIVSSGQEDFTAVPLDTAASLPSFSPFSADPFKEHATFDMLSEGLSARTIYKEKGSDIYKETTENARNPFLIEKNLREAPEMEYSEMKSPPSTKVEATIVSQTKEEMLLENGKEIYSLGKITAQQQDVSPEAHMELFEKHDEKESPKKVKYDIDDGGEKVALKEDTPSREQYVDFKPYEPIWEVKDTCHGVSSLKEAVISEVDCKLESSLDERFDTDKMVTIQKDYEKESEGSNEDLSFPSTPEAIKGLSQTYITCAKLEPTVTSEDNIVKSLSLLEDDASENKTDEKKIAEMKVQTWIERDFKLVGRQEVLEADYAKTDALSNISSDNAANVPEGLTPDLVQEAYESEMHDATCTKLAYETKIDLVQTSESLQEPLNPVVQLCPSFEGPETAPSPVLPDIVMEAPSNTGAASADAIAVQLEASPLETFTSVASYDNVKQVSEKPPLYQEELNISLKEAPGIKEEAAFKEPDHKNRAVTEEIETPYISIACDLIKETKVSSESPSPIFSDYSETLIECVSRDVPEHKEPVEKLSPQPENYDLLGNQPTPDFPQKENEVPPSLTATSKSVENTGKIGTDHGSMEELKELLPSTAKPYLESFRPELAFSRMPAPVPVEAASMEIDKKEKISLQMEDLNAVAYSAEMHIAEESKIGDKVLLPTESSLVQVTEDFVTLVTTESTPKLVTEVFDKEILYKDESKEMTNGIKDELRQLPCPELPHDLSLKNVKVKAEENVHVLEKPSEAVNREELEISKVSLLPADVSPLSAEKEVVSIVKPEALEKAVEREVPSGKEKEKTPAIFSAKLSKSSVVDLLYWRDIKKTGVVFGASLFLLLSLTVFSIVSVTAYIALALLSVTISFRIYKGVIQAIQKSDEGHPFRAYLESDVAVSEELVQKYSNVVLGHVNGTVKELRRLFLVDDLVDSLKFAVLMWVFTYVGALFNGLTLLILALISLFSVPVIYERHQAQIDHYLGLVNKNVKDAMAKIQAKIPGLKRKTE